MSFIASTAGPSHFHYHASKQCARFALLPRTYATTSSAVDDVAEDPPLPSPLDTDPPLTPRDEELDREAKAAALREKRLWSSGRGFAQWKRSFGAQYAVYDKGDRAKWLGGGVPFPANPTFRPPPPLSNDLQDMLYRDLTLGRKTAGVLANEYSVSKARITAVKKLKEVEAEMKRQSMSLQQAFLEGMEPLLAVHTAIDPRTKQYSERIQREAAQSRETHPSTNVEREEEQRYEAGVGSGGAFGDRLEQSKTEGIERSAWEWRDEDAVLGANEALETTREAARLAGRPSRTGVQGESERKEGLNGVTTAEEAFPTPLTTVSESADQKRHQSQESLPSTIIGSSAEKSTSTVYRFVDTSSRPMHQPKDVQKAMQDREKLRAKKAKRRAARV